MGLEMAIARVGVFAVFSISPWLANMAPATVVRPVAFCTLLLLIGLLTYVVFTFMDRKLDKQLGSGQPRQRQQFRRGIPASATWANISRAARYSGSSPYSACSTIRQSSPSSASPRTCWRATSASSAQTAADIFRWFPMGAAAITPLPGQLPRPQGQGRHDADLRRRSDDRSAT